MENLSNEDLVSWVIEAAEENESLYQKLRILIERAEVPGDKSWVQEMKAEIQQICTTHSYSDWEYIDIGNQLEAVLEPLEDAEITD